MLIQPPRLVDIDTSGETVIMRRLTSGWSASAVITRPKASWVDHALEDTSLTAESGTPGSGRGGGGSLFTSAPTAAQTRPSGVSGSKRSHSVS